MATGDLRFYRSDGSVIDELIAITGPFVHVDIELGDGTVIGELSTGLTRYQAPADLPAGRVVIYPTAQHTGAETLAEALNWAIEQLTAGEHGAAPEYGWADIVIAALDRWSPGWMFFGAPSEWDCSDFATRYALQAGLVLDMQAANTSEPHTVTPSMLAAALHVS